VTFCTIGTFYTCKLLGMGETCPSE